MNRNHKIKIQAIALAIVSVLPLTGYTQTNLSLTEALSLAAQSNADIKISALEIEKSQQQRVIARSSLLPSITAQASANHYFDLPPFFGFGETAENGKIPYGRFGGKDQLAAGISAVQPLYNPQAYPLVQRARLQNDESRAQARSKQAEVFSYVKQTYITILVLEQRIRLQQESLARNKRALQDARSLFAQGKALRVDTLRAFTAVKNLEPTYVQLLFSVETYSLRLKSFVGLDSLQHIVLTDSLSLPSSENIPDESSVYTAAKNNNPDYEVLRVREDISRASVKAASGLRMPVVAAVAQYQVQSQTNNFDYGKAYYPAASFVGLQISLPLFAGLGTQAKVRQASLAQEQTLLARQYAEEQLHALVHEVIARSRESAARLTNTQLVKETAQVSYNIIQYRYKSGIASRLELNDAEFALSTAQANYLEAVYDYLSARIQLEKLMGVTAS